MGVIESVVGLVEKSDEHRNQLQMPPLDGHAADYLGAIATEAMADGGIALSEEATRSAVDDVSAVLRRSRQIEDPAGARRVLSTLCAHHVLERQEYPAVAFRFEHQQFQEFYAAIGVAKKLTVLSARGDEGRREFAKTYLNEPGWAEPLRMIADDLRLRSGAGEEDGTTAISEGK
jgi:hypothetical protein